MENKYEIAVLLTCFNRCNMTVSCLEKLLKARDKYNDTHEIRMSLSVFLTDDNCTDGTSAAVRNCLKKETLHIIEADGTAYWAGGMRIAWNTAIQTRKYDFFLLLNDDTDVWENLFDELMTAHSFCVERYGKSGIYSGNTTWKNDHTKMSFGGKINRGGLINRFEWVYPNGTPQKCDIVNANILLVSNEVVENIGIFSDCFIHGAADNDYSMRANRAGFPVVVTSGYCGSCDADNYNHIEECRKLSQMSLSQRNKYFKNPVHSIHDKLRFTIKWRKFYIPVVILTHSIHKYFPKLYGKMMGDLH